MNIQEDSIDHEEFISPKDYINRFIEILEAQVAELKEFAASNPHIIRANLLQPTSDDVAKKFRAKIFNIFHLTGPFIDRNSADAVRTDTRIAIKKDFESKKIPLFTTVRGRGNTSDPKGYINSTISTLLDEDQKAYQYNIDIYSILNSNTGKLHPLYNALHRSKKI